MTEQEVSSPDRYAHLRANATRQKQTTVERLKAAIATLEAEQRPVTIFTIKEVSGLDYMAYYRNDEALTLFRRHSTHLQATRTRERGQQRTSRRKQQQHEESNQERVVLPRDPLLRYKKPRLVSELRVALTERDQTWQRYQALLQEHMQCGIAVARLEAQVAEYLAFMERFRTSLQREEQKEE
ncbi:MAG TPA: hypothetical protein VH593_22805 [Ktedonobacteraceae bacterium]|jgi:hypothetical protein